MSLILSRGIVARWRFSKSRQHLKIRCRQEKHRAKFAGAFQPVRQLACGPFVLVLPARPLQSAPENLGTSV
jgi:hypothetical protein